MKTVDASFLINYLVYPEEFDKHSELIDDILIAPAILIPEFLNALRKMVFRKILPRALANEIADRFADLPFSLFDLKDHRIELWNLLSNFTPYDATYVLLAQSTQTPLLTSDARLARAAERSTDVILVK